MNLLFQSFQEGNMVGYKIHVSKREKYAWRKLNYFSFGSS